MPDGRRLGCPRHEHQRTQTLSLLDLCVGGRVARISEGDRRSAGTKQLDDRVRIKRRESRDDLNGGFRCQTALNLTRERIYFR